MSAHELETVMGAALVVLAVAWTVVSLALSVWSDKR